MSGYFMSKLFSLHTWSKNIQYKLNANAINLILTSVIIPNTLS